MIELIFAVISSATFSFRMSSVWQVQDDMVYAAAGTPQPVSASENTKAVKFTSKLLFFVFKLFLKNVACYCKSVKANRF